MTTLSLKKILFAGLLLTCAARADAHMARMCDVTGNGMITALDAHRVLEFVAGMRDFTPEQQFLADATGNGHVTSYDTMCILQASAGKPVSGCLCGKVVQIP